MIDEIVATFACPTCGLDSHMYSHLAKDRVMGRLPGEVGDCLTNANCGHSIKIVSGGIIAISNEEALTWYENRKQELNERN